jgi:hypothetical protein
LNHSCLGVRSLGRAFENTILVESNRAVSGDAKSFTFHEAGMYILSLSSIFIHIVTLQLQSFGGIVCNEHSTNAWPTAFSSKDDPHSKAKVPEERRDHYGTEEQCEFPALDSNYWELMNQVPFCANNWWDGRGDEKGWC